MVDIKQAFVYIEYMELSIIEKIKLYCIRRGISEAELARRLGQSPANFNHKMQRGDFRVSDLEKIAAALGLVFVSDFVEKDDAGRG